MNGEISWISTAAIFGEPDTIPIESIAPVIDDSLEETLVRSMVSKHRAFRMFDNSGLLLPIGSNEAVRHCSHFGGHMPSLSLGVLQIRWFF